eukprot:939248_1
MLQLVVYSFVCYSDSQQSEYQWYFKLDPEDYSWTTDEDIPTTEEDTDTAPAEEQSGACLCEDEYFAWTVRHIKKKVVYTQQEYGTTYGGWFLICQCNLDVNMPPLERGTNEHG